jgi:hypothetical protein
VNQYLVYKGRVMARLVQPTALKEVFASSHWTWDCIGNTNVLIKRMSCKVSSSRRWPAKLRGPDACNVAYPLPGGVAWEFLVTAV